MKKIKNKIKIFLKGAARKILNDEIKEREALIERLTSYAKPHMPELKSDGSDQTYNLQYRFDVGCGYIPNGIFNIKNCIKIDKDTE